MMDVKSAFNVSHRILGRRLGELGIEPDLVRWTDSFMSGRKVRLVLEGKDGGGDRGPRWRQYCSRPTYRRCLITWKGCALGYKDCPSLRMWHGGQRGVGEGYGEKIEQCRGRNTRLGPGKWSQL